MSKGNLKVELQPQLHRPTSWSSRFSIRISSFGFFSSFVIGHSDFPTAAKSLASFRGAR
jgi:hypothetical protein